MTRCAVCGDELVDASRQFCGGDTCDRVLLPREGRDTVVWLGRVFAVALTLLVSLAVTQAADGQVPTLADIAACNEEAPRAIKAGTASPNGGDHARASRARAGGPTTSAGDATGGVVESPDPQIHGMQGAGAKTAAYQAAYRSCMRRKGF